MLPALQSHDFELHPDRGLGQEHGLLARVLGKLLCNVFVKVFSASVFGKGRAWTIFKPYWQESLTSLKDKKEVAKQ